MFSYKAEPSHEAVFPFSAAQHFRMQYLLIHIFKSLQKRKLEGCHQFLAYSLPFPGSPFLTPEDLQVYSPSFYQNKKRYENPFLVG